MKLVREYWYIHNDVKNLPDFSVKCGHKTLVLEGYMKYYCHKGFHLKVLSTAHKLVSFRVPQPKKTIYYNNLSYTPIPHNTIKEKKKNIFSLQSSTLGGCGTVDRTFLSNIIPLKTSDILLSTISIKVLFVVSKY